MAERSSRIESTTMTAVVALMALFPLLGRRDPALSRVREAPSAVEDAVRITSDDALFVAPSWVDPLGAASSAQKDAMGEAPRAIPAAPWTAERVAASGPPLVLIVTAPDGTTDIDAENRRRARYALAMAMSSLGWVQPDGGALRQVRCCLHSPQDSTWVFERYERVKSRDGASDLAAVVWMRQRQHADRSLACVSSRASRDVLHALTGVRVGEPTPPHRTRIIGPEDSDALVAEFRARAGQNSREIQDKLLSGELPEMFSVWATLSQQGLERELGGATVDLGPWTPMLVDDDRCVRALIGELVTRGFDPNNTGHRLAVLCDASTAYGRRMTQAVQDAVDRLAPKGPAGGAAGCVESHLYFSQIDGVWRKERKAEGGSKSEPRSDAKAPASGSEMLEGARGSSQKDYLRRLVGRLADQDQADLRSTRWARLGDPRHGRVFAVLVMAADPFDKFLLLEAVRAQLPNVTIGTLDIDAELLHRKAIPFTRNVLVASSYSLDPDATGPAYVTPFRDQYQTAVYHAVRRAMGSAGPGDDLPRAARVCEITTEGPRWLDHAGAPVRDDSAERWILAGLAAAATALVVRAGWRACAGARRLDGIEPIAHQLTPELMRWVLLELGVFSLIPAAMLAAGGGPGAEPMAWADGASAWPSIILRAFVAVGSLAFMLEMWRRMSLCAQWTIGQFRLTTRSPGGPADRAGGELRDLGRLLGELSRMLVTRPVHQVDNREFVAETEGRRFLELGRLSRRLGRSFVAAAVYCSAFILVWVLLALDYTPASIRSEGLRSADGALGFAVWILSTWMLFFLIDATLLTAAWIAKLSEGSTNYPPDVVEAASERLGIVRALVGGALDVTLVARAGQAVADLAYVPVLLLLLMMAAQARAFDNWSWNLPVLISFGLGFGMVVLSGFVLRQSAESARRLELMRLDQIVPVLKRQGKVVQADVDRAKGYIEGLNTGPYASFSEQPFFRIVFLPLSGAGIYGLIDLASRMMA